MVDKLPPGYESYVQSKGGKGITSFDEKVEYAIIVLDRISQQLGYEPGDTSPSWVGDLKKAIESLQGTVLRLAQLISRDPELVLSNMPFFRAQIKRVDTAGTAVRLPRGVKVPNGYYVAFKALRDNWRTVYLGNSAADAESHTTVYPLAPGEALDLQLSNLDNCWVDADRSGEGLTWIVEQEAGY